MRFTPQPRYPLLFWTLGPILVLSAIVTPIFLPTDGPFAVAATATITVAFAALFLALAHDRFGWAWRVLGGILVLGYVAYTVDMFRTGPLGLDAPRSEPTILNALRGLLFFGVPGLFLLLRGVPPRET